MKISKLVLNEILTAVENRLKEMSKVEIEYKELLSSDFETTKKELKAFHSELCELIPNIPHKITIHRMELDK